MLKAYCDGCDVELKTNLTEILDTCCYDINADVYCSICQKKAEELKDWAGNRREELKNQLKIETAAKRLEIFTQQNS